MKPRTDSTVEKEHDKGRTSSYTFLLRFSGQIFKPKYLKKTHHITFVLMEET